MKRWKLGATLGAAALAAAGVLVYLAMTGRLGGLAGRPPADPPEVQLELVHRALAETENLETAQADAHWTALSQQMPSDSSIALNRALNRLLHVDLAADAATNAPFDAQLAAEASLAIQGARRATDDYFKLTQDDVGRLWLSSRIDIQHALQLPSDAGEALRRDVLQRLTDAMVGEVGSHPGSAALGGLLMQVLDDLEATGGLTDDQLARAAATAEVVSAQHADNLYLALRAGRLSIATRSAGAAGPVSRSAALAHAIEPTLRGATAPLGLTPGELAESILGAIENDNWQQAEQRMRLWFNVLNSTDLVRTDRRRAMPHPLDLLSFETHRRLSALVAAQQPVPAGQGPLQLSAVASGLQNDLVCAVAMDVNLNLIPEIVAVSETGLLTLWRSGGTISAWEQIAELNLNMPCSGLVAADLFMVDTSDPNRLQSLPGREATAPPERHTTLPTLMVYGAEGVKLISVDGRQSTSDSDRLSVVAGPTGLEAITAVTTAVAGDLDGDGDLDLVFATAEGGLRFFINRGNRSFFELDLADQTDSMAALTGIADMAIVDLDRDLDLDIVTVDRDTGRVGVIENLLHLQFRHRELSDIPALAGANQVAVAELDGNVSWDIVVGSPERVQVVYSHTAAAGTWVVDRTELLADARSPFLLADLNNDSWQELLVLGGDGAVAHSLAGSTAARAVALGEVSGIGVAAIDFNLNGKLDLLAISEGTWTIYENATLDAGHHIAVRLRGIDDNNVNSGRVNHYAIGAVVELRSGPHYRAQVVTAPTTHFGLGHVESAGSLRVIFPNGLTQTIDQPPLNTLVEEQQTLKGSCPYLYAWNGEQFAFVTDCLWAAPLGLQVAAGVVAKDRPWEYLKVDGDLVRPRDGRYEFRITEELWEIAYFDHVSLLAVDHPADVDVWTNEKVGPAEIAKPKIHAFASSDRIELQQAMDTHGNDVTRDLRAIDGQFVQGFERRFRQGLCPPHWVDLDFGAIALPPANDASIFLVMTGWILPTDTSLNIQIDQNPDLPAIEFPSLWVPDPAENDGWRREIDFIGFPGGKTKTIVVDVTDAIDLGDPRLRIRTSAQIYWDAAQLVMQADTPKVITHELSLLAADLRYRGFSRKYHASAKSPEWYDYSQINHGPVWPPLQGRFSAYGPCKPLLDHWDDAMVVMGSGDELRLSFSVPNAEVPPGWKRDFVLHCVGWDKDADLNTLAGQSSEPLPFREMASYPPTAEQSEAYHRVLAKNAEHLQRTYRFRDFWARLRDTNASFNEQR